MIFKWNEEKNKKLIEERGISFEEIVDAFNSGVFVDFQEQKNDEYSHQEMMIIWYSDYIYCVPLIDKGDYFYLITVFKSRKMTKKYLKGEL